MRGRILSAVLVTAAILAGCDKKDSLYIEPGKAEAAKPPKHERPKPAPVDPGPAKPTPPPKG